MTTTRNHSPVFGQEIINFSDHPDYGVLTEGPFQVLIGADGEQIQQFAKGTAPSEIEMWLEGYEAGRKAGRIEGKAQLQFQLQRFLGLTGNNSN